MTNQPSPTPTQETTPTKKEGNTKALLTYVAGWITGLVFLLTEKEDKFVRFHAAQSVVVFGALMILSFVPILGALLSIVLFPVTLILWIVLMIKAYQNEKFMLPVVGEWAQQLEKKIK
jgi:uncharacterized membrane protein